VCSHKALLFEASAAVSCDSEARHLNVCCLVCFLRVIHGAGSTALPQDLAVFLMKAQAARGSINRILSTLATLQPQPPQPITVQTSASGPPLQYAPEAASFAAAPAQTAAVLTDAEAKQQLAWASAHLAQVECQLLQPTS